MSSIAHMDILLTIVSAIFHVKTPEVCELCKLHCKPLGPNIDIDVTLFQSHQTTTLN